MHTLPPDSGPDTMKPRPRRTGFWGIQQEVAHVLQSGFETQSCPYASRAVTCSCCTPSLLQIMEVLPVSGRSAALCKVHVKPCWISPCQLPQFTASRVTQCPVQTQQLSRPLCFQELSSTRRLGSTALSRAVSGKSSAEVLGGKRA